jgi:hypothetical protein
VHGGHSGPRSLKGTLARLLDHFASGIVLKDAGGWYSIEFVPDGEKMAFAARMKHVFAFSLIMLMLSVSSLAAACDLSCGFASSWADCHTAWKEAQDSTPDAASMGVMGMPGMVMASTVSADQETVSNAPQGLLEHAGLVDMSTCERQSCDQAQASAAQANRLTASHYDSILTIAGFPRVDNSQTSFRHARDDVASNRAHIRGPFGVSLRI